MFEDACTLFTRPRRLNFALWDTFFQGGKSRKRNGVPNHAGTPAKNVITSMLQEHWISCFEITTWCPFILDEAHPSLNFCSRFGTLASQTSLVSFNMQFYLSPIRGRVPVLWQASSRGPWKTGIIRAAHHTCFFSRLCYRFPCAFLDQFLGLRPTSASICVHKALRLRHVLAKIYNTWGSMYNLANQGLCMFMEDIWRNHFITGGGLPSMSGSCPAVCLPTDSDWMIQSRREWYSIATSLAKTSHNAMHDRTQVSAGDGDATGCIM